MVSNIYTHADEHKFIKIPLLS